MTKAYTHQTSGRRGISLAASALTASSILQSASIDRWIRFPFIMRERESLLPSSPVSHHSLIIYCLLLIAFSFMISAWPGHCLHSLISHLSLLPFLTAPWASSRHAMPFSPYRQSCSDFSPSSAPPNVSCFIFFPFFLHHHFFSYSHQCTL